MSKKFKYAQHKGMILLKKPIKRTVGSWVEMTFDAKIKHRGLTWLRIQGGFGHRGDREDWICDIPALCVSVCDYLWNGSDWGHVHYKSFRAAMTGQVACAVNGADSEVSKLAEKINSIQHAAAMLKRSASQ